ncbi:class I SAM-dependent methyltransferase [Planomonospora sp. ID82291]|uniref:class I SAM-dependent methyltransferase n=1 Tax=Planomonospora sp. ID82291 TaxID=2738136 RepID=UPI0018C37BB5|nr:class I SAM-dependent methyltransferase [Planomonospora sp. ID82291]MBG0818666.1 class I SAM-dependent methyltransferase [Planomonospora sp. ID82291]
MSTANAFTRSTAQRELYGSGARLATRTRALHRAKTSGRPVADVIAELAAAHLPTASGTVVADIGCGRGTTSRVLTERLRPRCLLAVDASAAMITDARARITGDAPIVYLQADFHRLPLTGAACDLVVAAFCLYHSRDPRSVVAELARVLRPGGLAALVTKSADSYQALDHLVAGAGLDPDALERPSLYSTAHSGNLPTLLPPSLRTVHLEHERHTFDFTDLGHVAAYLATTPKYELPPGLAGDPDAITSRLRARLPDGPVHAASTVTYLLARREDTT